MPDPLLPPIIFENEQWAVTGFGIECTDGTYQVGYDVLTSNWPEFSWPDHMALKTWVDLSLFLQAHRIAVYVHGCQNSYPTIDEFDAVLTTIENRAKRLKGNVGD